MKYAIIVNCPKGSISEESKEELRKAIGYPVAFLDYDKSLPMPEIVPLQREE